MDLHKETAKEAYKKEVEEAGHALYEIGIS